MTAIAQNVGGVRGGGAMANPFEAPTSNINPPSPVTSAHDDVWLTAVAKAQRQMLGGFAFALVLARFHPALALLCFVGLGWLGFTLARVLNRALAPVYGLLCALPVVNIVFLFILSGAATRALRKAGVKVGFLGASVPLRRA